MPSWNSEQEAGVTTRSDHSMDFIRCIHFLQCIDLQFINTNVTLFTKLPLTPHWLERWGGEGGGQKMPITLYMISNTWINQKRRCAPPVFLAYLLGYHSVKIWRLNRRKFSVISISVSYYTPISVEMCSMLEKFVISWVLKQITNKNTETSIKASSTSSYLGFS